MKLVSLYAQDRLTLQGATARMGVRQPPEGRGLPTGI